MKKRSLFATLLAVLCLVSILLLSVDAQAATYSGTCGDNVKWSLNTSTGALTISGTGEMTNYGHNSPWLEYRDDIKRVVIKQGVTNVGTTAFSCCKNITSVVIPNSVTIIGDGAFYWCSGLPSVEIPDSVITIGDEAFQYCYSLESVTIGNSVKTIGDDAFQSNSLTSVEIPDSVKTIGKGAFYNNDMTTVEIPANVTSIGSAAFARCTSLTGIWVDSRNAYYCNDEYGVLFNKDKTELIAAPGTISGTYSIPDSVTTIVDHAFDYCTSLAGIVLPGRITSIGGWAFNYCIKLTDIVFPESLTSIGSYAFASGDRLKEIIFRGDAPSIGANAFGKSAFNYVTATAYYPANNATWTADVMQNYGGEITWVINCTHEWVDATCTAPKTCSLCGTTEGSALEHTYESVVTAPTCTEQGYTTHTCSVCTHSYKDNYVAENGHAWGEWYTVDEASCTAEGMEQRDCDACDSFETNTLPMKEHSYESVVTAPTCTEQGYTTHTCSVCTHSYKDNYVAENGHTEVIDAAVAATCTTTGLTEGKHCSVCQHVLVAQEMIPAQGHGDENKDYTCDVCGSELCTDHTEQVLPGTAATCEKSGLTEGKKCAVCGEILKAQETIPAKEHAWQEATCEAAKNCATCGKTEGTALGHSYGEWTEVKAPTVEEAGLSERTCATCGGKEQKELPKLDPPATEPTQPAAPTEPAKPETKPEPTQPSPTVPQTDDDRDEGQGSPVLLILLSAIGGAAVAVFFMLLLLKKKKKEE